MLQNTFGWRLFTSALPPPFPGQTFNFNNFQQNQYIFRVRLGNDAFRAELCGQGAERCGQDRLEGRAPRLGQAIFCSFEPFFHFNYFFGSFERFFLFYLSYFQVHLNYILMFILTIFKDHSNYVYCLQLFEHTHVEPHVQQFKRTIVQTEQHRATDTKTITIKMEEKTVKIAVFEFTKTITENKILST